jgi:hypothetical protein
MFRTLIIFLITNTITLNVAVAATIDFEQLRVENDGVHNIGTSYNEDGFQLYYDSLSGIQTYGTLNEDFAGSTTINGAGGFGSGFSLYIPGGTHFNAFSFDMVRADFSNFADFGVDFIGKFYDGRPYVNQSFSVDGSSSELQTFYFNDDFRDIKTLFWYAGGTPRAQFDNLVVTPVPLPGACWLFASSLIGLLGFRRKFR